MGTTSNTLTAHRLPDIGREQGTTTRVPKLATGVADAPVCSGGPHGPPSALDVKIT